MPITDSIHYKILKELEKITKELKSLRKDLKKWRNPAWASLVCFRKPETTQEFKRLRSTTWMWSVIKSYMVWVIAPRLNRTTANCLDEASSKLVLPISLSRQAAEIQADRDADGSKMSRILLCIERGIVIRIDSVGSVDLRRLILLPPYNLRHTKDGI